MIVKSLFDNYCGKEVHLYTLDNGVIKAGVLDYGGIINFIKVKCAGGEKNVLVTYKSVKGYEGKGYCGSSVGRVANRIARSRFTLNGREYKVSSNEGETCLHGGIEGFDKKFYNAEIKGETLVLTHISEDGEMGFPGRLEFTAEFTLDGNSLEVKYSGLSDKDTVFSPTNHAYFNLNGGGEIMNTRLKINADGYTPVDGKLIPLGTVESVKGTPYDFTSFKTIGKDIGKVGKIGTYDVNFALNGGTAVEAEGNKSGIKLKLETNLPGVQFYAGRPSEEVDGEGGYGFCLEPQFFPDAVNVEGFETPLLPANVRKTYKIKYTFGY